MMWPTTPVSPLIDAAALRALLDDPALRIIDARFDLMNPNAGRAAWLSARIPGARYAHLSEDLSDPSRPASEGRHPLPSAPSFARTLAGWGVTPSTPVVVYDASSGAMAAARLWWLLRWMGHENVRVLDGGFAAWSVAGGSFVRGEPDVEATGKPMAQRRAADVAAMDFVSADEGAAVLDWRPGSAPLASVEMMDARSNTPHDPRTPPRICIDARAPERFRGDIEPLDPRAGHIPGALNRPFADNLFEGRFKPVAQLRAEWSALLSDGAEPVLYCGSGVTACHNALALVAAGWPMPMLYAPSWSGWVSDVRRPVATGE